MQLSPSARKAIGLITIIVFGLIELLLIAVLIYTPFDDTAQPGQAWTYLFPMGIMAFPIWWGFNLWKSGAKKPIPPTGQLAPSIENNEDALTIKTHITLSEYRKVVFLLTYTNPVIIFVYILGISFLGFYVSNGSSSWWMLFIVIFLCYLPIAVIRSAKRAYDTAKILHEPITYTFTPDSIISTGHSFNSTMRWQTLHKVKETKRWFLLYCNTQSLMIIPKESFPSEEELTRFRGIAGIVR
jgi:hypothetical protein